MTKKISAKGCRAKGHSFERWVAKQFAQIFPDAKRHLEYQASEANGCDLTGVGPYRVQCKRNRKYANPNKLLEVKADGVKILVTKGDNLEPVACLYFSDLLELISFYKKSVEKL